MLDVQRKSDTPTLGLWHLHRELNGLKAIIWCFNRKYNALVFITCLFPLSTSFNLQARLVEGSSPRTKFSTLRKYTFLYIEIKSFSTNWTYKNSSIEQIYHYFQLSSLALYFQAGRRKEVEGKPYHKSFQNTDCKYDFQKAPQSHRHGFKTHLRLDFDHLYNFVPSISPRLSSFANDVNESLNFIPYNVKTIKMAIRNNRTLRRKRLVDCTSKVYYYHNF